MQRQNIKVTETIHLRDFFFPISGNSTSVGGIVGIVIAILVIVAAVTGLVMYCKKKKVKIKVLFAIFNSFCVCWTETESDNDEAQLYNL